MSCRNENPNLHAYDRFFGSVDFSLLYLIFRLMMLCHSFTPLLLYICPVINVSDTLTSQHSFTSFSVSYISLLWHFGWYACRSARLARCRRSPCSTYQALTTQLRYPFVLYHTCLPTVFTSTYVFQVHSIFASVFIVCYHADPFLLLLMFIVSFVPYFR
jgi:hypothetical protein